MPEGLTGYHLQLCELSSALVEHGFGELRFEVSSNQDNRVKVLISCGKTYVIFIKKPVNLKERDIL